MTHQAGLGVRQRTSEPRQLLTTPTKRRPVYPLIGTACSLMRVSRRPPRYNQPPVNPARRSPATKYGQRRVMAQTRPVR
jgi:hypothetical protein